MTCKNIASCTRSLACTAFAIAATSLPASAHIACDGGYQIVNGAPVATPFCADQILATTARDHGMPASTDAIRRSPALAGEICRWSGSDVNLSTACANQLP